MNLSGLILLLGAITIDSGFDRIVTAIENKDICHDR